MKLEERLYALRQCDSYGERYGIIMFFQSRNGVWWFAKPAFTFSYIRVDRYVPISKSHQQMQESMFYERLGHTGAVHESMLFRRLPQSLIHVPYTEGRCSWGRINNANDNTSAVAILAHPDLPTFLITDVKVWLLLSLFGDRWHIQLLLYAS